MLRLEFLHSGDQLFHVSDGPDEDLELEFLLLASLLSIGAFFVFVVYVLTDGLGNESAKGIEGLVYLCTASLLDTRMVLPAKGVACRPGGLSRLLGPALCLGGRRRSDGLVVVRIIVAIELVRLGGDILVVGVAPLCRVRRLERLSGGFCALDPITVGIESDGRHGAQKKRYRGSRGGLVANDGEKRWD